MRPKVPVVRSAVAFGHKSDQRCVAVRPARNDELEIPDVLDLTWAAVLAQTVGKLVACHSESLVDFR